MSESREMLSPDAALLRMERVAALPVPAEFPGVAWFQQHRSAGMLMAAALIALIWGLAAAMSSDASLAGVTLSGLLLTCFLAVAVVTDLQGRKIYNWTTYPGIACGLVLNAALSGTHVLEQVRWAEWLGGIGLVPSLTGAMLCFSGMFALFLLLGGGAGDVKLMALLGAFTGWQSAWQIWVCAMLLAAIFSLCYAVIGVGPRALLGSMLLWVSAPGAALKTRELVTTDPRLAEVLRFRIPLAPFFAAGTLIVLRLAESGRTLVDLL